MTGFPIATPPLRIALFTYSTKPRGSVIHALELAEALHHLGHQVCLYALSKPGDCFDYKPSYQVCLIPAQPAPAEIDALIQQRIQEFVNYLSQELLGYDIYHAQDCLSANALAILRQQHRIPQFVRTIHHIEDYSSIYLQHCQDRSIREADFCFCVSERWRQVIQQQYHIDPPRVLNGVNLARFSRFPNGIESTLKDRFSLHHPLYLTVGGIEPRKNSLNLLKAFALVQAQIPTAQLVIAGGATLFDYQPYRQQFFELVEQLDLHQSVIVTGVLTGDELAALYRLADAFVFPSVKEGWGLVLLEAIASGLPVITSNQPPFTEFLSPQQALWVNPETPSDIATAMYSILQPELAESLVAQSQTLLQNYSWSASAQLHLQHYRRLTSCTNHA